MLMIPTTEYHPTALLNPQKASGAGHSLLGSGALPRELKNILLTEREKIEISG